MKRRERRAAKREGSTNGYFCWVSVGSNVLGSADRPTVSMTWRFDATLACVRVLEARRLGYLLSQPCLPPSLRLSTGTLWPRQPCSGCQTTGCRCKDSAQSTALASLLPVLLCWQTTDKLGTQAIAHLKRQQLRLRCLHRHTNASVSRRKAWVTT